MTKPTTRRRIYLPIFLATSLLTAAGTGGYFFLQRNSEDQAAGLSADMVEDLDSGFAEGSTSAKMAAVADRWVDAPPSAPVQQANYDSLHPATDTYDRYAAPPSLPGVESAETPLAEALPPLESTDRYDAPLPPLESENSQAITRGQMPLEEEPPLAPLEGPPANPLRYEEEEHGSPEAPAGIPESARQAFEASQQGGDSRYAPAVNSSALPQETANPLRALSDQPTPGGSLAPLSSEPLDAPPAGRFDDARPIDSPAASAPGARYASASPANPTSEPLAAHNNPYRDEAALPPAGNTYAPAPLDDSSFGHGSPAPSPLSGSPGPSTMMPGEGTGRPGERALEGPQRPALVLQKFAPPEIQIGKPAKFVIKVRNVGQRPAEDVTVEDSVPQGTEFVAATPQAERTGPGILRWQLGTLSPGEERTVEVELTPTDEGEIGSVARVTFSSQASAKTVCTRPQLALRMTAPSEVLVGRQQPVTIELHNPGTGDATGVMLLENVPENVRHAAGPSLEFEVGTLRAGETRRMELILTAEKPGPVVNVLTARADGNLQVQQAVKFEVIAPALTVAVDGPKRRYLERPATYTITVQNPGTAVARDVQLITKLPRGMRFERANNLGEYDSATHSVYWSLAELPQGENGVVELVAMPIQTGDHTLEVQGRAREGLEDRTTQQVTIEGLAAIMFTVADTQDPIEVGGSTSYDIRVVNQGTKAATNVQVRVLLPQGMKAIGATGETRHALEAEGVIFEPLARLAPKADSLYRVEVQGVQSGDQRIAVEVLTDDISQPVRKEESTRVFGDE